MLDVHLDRYTEVDCIARKRSGSNLASCMVRYNAVRLGELGNIRVIPSGVVEHEPEVVHVLTLTSRKF